MTVPSETNRSGPYNGNGVTTVFSYGFRIVNEAHLRVIKTVGGVETVLAIDTDYIVSDVGNPAGGQIALVAAPATGETITILRNVPFTQETDLENQGAYYAQTVEDALDLAAMRDQQVAEELDRTLRIPASASAVNLVLPTPEVGKLLAWNNTADAIENLTPSELASVITYGTANSDIFTGDGATTDFTLSSNPASINNLDVAVGGATQLPGIDYTWTSGTTLAFTAAPANGVKILARYMRALAQGTTDDDLVVSSDGAGGSLWSTIKGFIAYLRSSAGSAIVGFLQGGTGAVARSMEGKARESVSVMDFGAVGDGATDDTAAIQKAITYVASRAGGTVFFPHTSTGYRCTGTLNVLNHGVTLEFESAFTKLMFANGAADCIVLDGSVIGGAGIYNLTIRNGLIDHTGKTGGTTIKLYKANNILIDRVQINNAYQPLDFNVVNNVSVSFCQVNNVAAGQFALRFRAPGDNSARSDVLTLTNTVLQCGTTGADGIEWDGLAHTIRIFGGGILGARDAFVIKNTTASASYYPAFLMAYDLEIDGTTRKAVVGNAGAQMNFVGCDLFCLASASGPVVDVLPDTGASFTNSWRFVGGRITGGQGKLLSYNAKNLLVSGVTLAGGASAGSGSAEAIAIGANAENCLIVGNNIGQYWGSVANHSYAITVAAGAVRVRANENNCYSCVTGEVLDNSGSSTVWLGGGIDKSGNETAAFLGVLDVTAAKNGVIEMRAYNRSSGAAMQARWTVATGSANAFRSGTLIDNSGSPYYIINGGAGITIEYNDIDQHVWRTNGGTEKARLTTARLEMGLPVRLKSYTVATLPGSPQEGDLAFVTDSNTAVYNAAVAGGGANRVKVCYLNGGWKVG